MLIRFFRSEPAAAIVLLLSAALALVVANTGLNDSYHDLLGRYVAGISIHHWINDALMAIFFLMVGLEIKRELTLGALSRMRDRVLPGLAALGGMLAPAITYTLINRNHADLTSGWAIPAATDIAFTLGVLAVLGKRVPAGIRVLVVGIAIIDDLLAILVIALFYSHGLQLQWLALAGLATLGLIALNRRSTMSLLPYLALGVVLWIALYNSGLHATLTGVILALTIPATHSDAQQISPLTVWEHKIVYSVNFGILPLFAFANAGVSLRGMDSDAMLGTLPMGIVAGLFIGKQIGIFGTIWLLVRIGIAHLPNRVNWQQIHAMSVLCGIGFTMSLFIGGLAFVDSPEHMDGTKIGVIAGSLISATVGSLLMLRGTRERAEERLDTH